MARADDDSWDLANSVGATATMVAAARAAATRRLKTIVNDPFAEPLVRAVGSIYSPGLPRVSWTGSTPTATWASPG